MLVNTRFSCGCVNYLNGKRIFCKDAEGGENVTNVRAKFKVNSKEETFNGNEIQVTVKMNPVYGGTPISGDSASDENKSFWKYTPGGELRLNVINKSAADYFELGKEYYLDFTKAE